MSSEMRIGGLVAPYDEATDKRAGLGGARYFFPAKSRAFRAAAAKPGPNVFLLNAHDSKQPLARTGNGSLRLMETQLGLSFEATLPDTTVGKDFYQAVKTGLLSQMSVGFEPGQGDDDITIDVLSDDEVRVNIHRASVLEVSLVAWPALKSSSVRALRAGEIARMPTVVVPKTLTVVEARRQLGAMLGRKVKTHQEIEREIRALCRT